MLKNGAELRATTTAVSLPETFTSGVKREWRSTKVAM
jgi:hypothetical protein